ncbi:MAG: hypothetical protein ACP6IP_01180 [Candidatus Njordarchaeia archaeon]
MESNNILSLIRLGFLPPSFSEEEFKKTIYYKFWDSFRIYCYYADVKELVPKPKIYCRKTNSPCSFATCPLIGEAIKKYERDTGRY